MKQQITFTLIILVVMCLSVKAQVYYERWIDSNRSAAEHGNLILGEQNVTVDASNIHWPGLHFLNIVPYDESGQMGVWKCIPFLMPEAWPSTTHGNLLEYWVTSYDAAPKRIAYESSATSLDIDISQMSYGLHFLNVRTLNKAGEAGAWRQIPFYISNFIFDPEELTYEYWIDNGEHSSGIGYFPGSINLKINTEGISYGQHTFNFKGANRFGIYGEVYSADFTLSDKPTGIDATTEVEQLSIRAADGVFVIDSNTHRQLAIYQPNGVLVRTVSLNEGQTVVSGLPAGIYLIEGLKLVLR